MNLIKSAGGYPTAEAPLPATQKQKNQSQPTQVTPSPKSPEYQEIAFLSDLDAYDANFINTHTSYAKEVKNQEKLTDEMTTRRFYKELLFAYSHPKNRYTNKKAKRFGNQVVKRTLNQVNFTSDQEQVIHEHQELIKTLITYTADRIYENTYREKAKQFEKKSGALIHVLYRKDMINYLSESTKEIYYQIQKEAAEHTYQQVGLPDNTVLTADIKGYEIEKAKESLHLYLSLIKSLELPKILKSQLKLLFYYPEKEAEFPLVQKHFEALINTVDQEYLKSILDQENVKEHDQIRVANLRDHLLFQHEYFNMVDEHEPPLTQDEQKTLLLFLEGEEKSLPPSLKTIHEVCYRYALEKLQVAEFKVNMHWQLNKKTMREANILMETIHREVKTDDQNSLEKQIQSSEIQIKKQVGFPLKDQRELDDTKAFIEELEHLFDTSLKEEDLIKILQKQSACANTKEEVEKILQISQNALFEKRGTDKNWLPDISLAQKIVHDHLELKKFKNSKIQKQKDSSLREMLLRNALPNALLEEDLTEIAKVFVQLETLVQEAQGSEAIKDLITNTLSKMVRAAVKNEKMHLIVATIAATTVVCTEILKGLTICLMNSAIAQAAQTRAKEEENSVTHEEKKSLCPLTDFLKKEKKMIAEFLAKKSHIDNKYIASIENGIELSLKELTQLLKTNQEEISSEKLRKKRTSWFIKNFDQLICSNGCSASALQLVICGEEGISATEELIRTIVEWIGKEIIIEALELEFSSGTKKNQEETQDVLKQEVLQT